MLYTFTEKITLKVVRFMPIRKGKERIVDFIRNNWLGFPLGSMRQCQINEDIPITVDISERIQAYMYFIGEYERYETKKIIECIEPGDIVLDIGANIGYFSLIASKKLGSEGHCFSFEASPSVYKLLHQNCVNSPIKNITPLKLAVADREGVLQFNLPRNSQEQGSGSLASIGRKGDIEVEATSIDIFCKNRKLSKIDFIKIDIEGAEIKAFLGSRETILKHKPKIIFEFSPARYENQEKSDFDSLIESMKEIGYEFQVLTKNGHWTPIESFPKLGVWTVYASK